MLVRRGEVSQSCFNVGLGDFPVAFWKLYFRSCRDFRRAVVDELRSGDPRRIGPFLIESRLGSGGMGKVYLGSANYGRIKAAIKVIDPERSGDPEFRERFSREVAAATRIRHPRTVRVLDFNVSASEPWLATEYVQGTSLQQRISDDGPMDVQDAVAFGLGVTQGIAAIHSADLVHRDLKPSNIMLTAGGPKIIDFGLAFIPHASALTGTGIPLGTPGYLAPEQAQGLRVSPAADIFSLGAVLAFAVSGQPPFGGGGYSALLWRVVNEQPDVSHIPDVLQRVVRSCLEKHPKDRPSIDEVKRSLEVIASQAGAYALNRRMQVLNSWRTRKVMPSVSRRILRTKVKVIAVTAALSLLSGATVGWIERSNENAEPNRSGGVQKVDQGTPPKNFVIPDRKIDPLRVDWRNRTYSMYAPDWGIPRPIRIKDGVSRGTEWGDVYLTQVLHTTYQGTPITFAVLDYAFKTGPGTHGLDQFYVLNCLKYRNGRYEVIDGLAGVPDITVPTKESVESRWENWQVMDEGILIHQNRQLGTVTVYTFDESCIAHLSGGYDATEKD
ncbi:serine/threonine-protein kinase [Actinacidiphila glaucinigra]|uniref:serine/threonine protein kinase n=1 Tax=Actinacidiphila glaucinigra TaxID=235986 RepID=UPI0033D64CAB